MDFADKLDLMDDDCDIEGFPIEQPPIMPDLTPLEAAETLELHAPFIQGTYRDAMLLAASYLRKIAAGEYKPVPICCIECEYSLPMDMKKYPDLTCHLSGGNFRVRTNMSCPCAKRAGRDDSHASQ